ncbi:hypothetical protein B0H11DRAFT_195843 [Mycena galericulata]|nr:hypothetical protein B0H11DRAFT_195843 [Mycena galericulata]
MWTSTFLSSQRLKTSAPLLLFLSCIARESLRDERAPSTVPFKLSVDLAQIVFSLFLYLLARTKPSNSYGLPNKDGDEESIAMDGPHAPLDSIHDATIPTGSIRFNLLGGAIGALYAIQAFTDEESAKIKNLTELHVMFPVCTLVLLLYLRLAFGRSVESNSWSLVALQFCGSYMVKSTVSARFSQTNIPTLAAFAVVSALAFITSYYTSR